MQKRKCKTCGQQFTPQYDHGHNGRAVKQPVCSCKCMVSYYAKQNPKSKKLARECAKMVGRRSMGEVQFDAEYLESKVSYKYEPDTFTYIVNETRKYTPDFKIKRPSNRTPLYIEYKGVLDVKTRKKMKLVRQQYPKVDIRLVFQKASNKIRKGSKTTYGMWADQHGFLWADGEIPKVWLR